jgi:hypothetical protein
MSNLNTPAGTPAANPQETHRPATRWAAGLALMLIGFLMLAGQLTKDAGFGQLVLPALAAIFLVWGIATRHAGPIIPGAILAGVSLGTALENSLVIPGVADPGAPIILLSLALGFAAITPLTAAFTRNAQWWGAIVGALCAIVGVAILIGGAALDVLAMLGSAWPLILIGLGVYLLWQQARPGGAR